VDRVQADVAAAANELDLDHNQVVNMVQVLADDLLRVPIIVLLDYQVATGAHPDLVRYVTWEDELAVVPLYFDLFKNVNNGKAQN